MAGYCSPLLNCLGKIFSVRLLKSVLVSSLLSSGMVSSVHLDELNEFWVSFGCFVTLSLSFNLSFSFSFRLIITMENTSLDRGLEEIPSSLSVKER